MSQYTNSTDIISKYDLMFISIVFTFRKKDTYLLHILPQFASINVNMYIYFECTAQIARPKFTVAERSMMRWRPRRDDHNCAASSSLPLLTSDQNEKINFILLKYLLTTFISLPFFSICTRSFYDVISILHSTDISRVYKYMEHGSDIAFTKGTSNIAHPDSASTVWESWPYSNGTSVYWSEAHV